MVNKSCDNCHWNYGEICIGLEKDTPIEEAKQIYPNACEEWKLAFRIFMGYDNEDEDV